MKEKTNLIYDKEFRQKIIQNPVKYAEQLGIEIADGIEIVVIKNTKNTAYIPFSQVGVQELDMLAINAAVKAGSVSSVSSGSSVASVTSTVSTATSAASLGCVDPDSV